MTAIRVVLAEDQPMVRAGFRALLDSRSDIEVVGEAATVAQSSNKSRRVACKPASPPTFSTRSGSSRAVSHCSLRV
jgi:hypothetical protein